MKKIIMLNGKKARNALNKSTGVLNKLIPILLGVIIGVWCLMYAFFFLWGVMSSFKDSIFFLYMNPIGLTYEGKLVPYDHAWSFVNYKTVWESMVAYMSDGSRVYIMTMIKNSLLYCVGNSVIYLSHMTIVTYVLSKYKKNFPWLGILWWIYIITNMIPFTSDMGSELKLWEAFGIYDNMLGNWLYNCGAFGGNFLLLYGAWNSIDHTLMEAAQIDGASTWDIFAKVMFPQMFGFYLVLVLQSITNMWDEYKPMIVMLPSYPSVASGAFTIQFSLEPNVSETTKIAALMALSTPMIIMFFAMRTQLLKGMSMMEGIKG